MCFNVCVDTYKDEGQKRCVHIENIFIFGSFIITTPSKLQSFQHNQLRINSEGPPSNPNINYTTSSEGGGMGGVGVLIMRGQDLLDGHTSSHFNTILGPKNLSIFHFQFCVYRMHHKKID